jgi:hypothetical protein
MMNIEAIYKGGPCPPYMSGHDVLGILRNPIFIRKFFGSTGFQPVQAQAKACGYILPWYPLITKCKIPAGHYWYLGGFSVA